MTPEFIGRYRIEAVLGHGAMGTVFKAHDPEIERPVAIKLVRAELLSGAEHAEYLARFRREAQAAARCVHPNIVAIYDFAAEGGNPFLAMEFVPGVPLNQAVSAGSRLTPDAAVRVVGQLLDALVCAHTMGVIHRDLKPANLLLLADGRLKVTDFGVSRLDASDLTAVGSLLGTPSYMSPEQLRGEDVDARSDLFSAGIVLFELLSGAKPFPGKTFSETMQKLLSDAPADLSSLKASVPEEMWNVLSRMLAKPVQERFPSAAAAAAALRRTVVPSGPSTRSGAWADTQVVANALNNGAEAGGLRTPRSLAPEAIARLEALLAIHVGPMARHLVRDALTEFNHPDPLYRRLAANIDLPDARARFLRDATSSLGADGSFSGMDIGRPKRVEPPKIALADPTPAPAPTRALPISKEELAILERQLTRTMGPIARILIKRAMAGAGSATELRRIVAEHIENPSERAAFIREGLQKR
jgi:eukaryotic-like serine/threonine-protein kinase